MDFSKLASLITPFVIVSLYGVIVILQGFVHMEQQNNVLQFLIGIPIAAGMLGLDWLVRKIAQRHTLHVWILELVVIAFVWYISSTMPK